jgi:hypothetical protein
MKPNFSDFFITALYKVNLYITNYDFTKLIDLICILNSRKHNLTGFEKKYILMKIAAFRRSIDNDLQYGRIYLWELPVNQICTRHCTRAVWYIRTMDNIDLRYPFKRHYVAFLRHNLKRLQMDYLQLDNVFEYVTTINLLEQRQCQAL